MSMCVLVCLSMCVSVCVFVCMLVFICVCVCVRELMCRCKCYNLSADGKMNHLSDTHGNYRALTIVMEASRKTG